MRGISKTVVLASIFAMAVGVISAPASAPAVDLEHSFVIGGDVGFTLDPDLFSSAIVGEYHVTSNVALGPLVSLSFDNDTVYFSTSGIAKYKANLAETAKLKPYGLVGVGFLVKNEKHRGDWRSDTDFLFPVGGGFEYWWTDRLAWGANIIFNISNDIYLSAMFGLRTNF